MVIDAFKKKRKRRRRRGEEIYSIFTTPRKPKTIFSHGRLRVHVVAKSRLLPYATVNDYTAYLTMSLARSSTAFDPSPSDPGFFEREKERLIEDISTVS